jgi:hypothetical protein
VLNIHADGSLALNSTANSFDPARDTAMAVFFTGLGSFPDLQDGVPWTYNPADNVADAGEAPVTLFSYSFVAKVLYAGPAPGTVGVDQLNIMPDQTGYIESCHMPIYLASYATQNVSQLATVSIHTGGGVCVDPAPDSEGSITWQKNTVFDVGSTTATEGVQAKFLQGYGVELPNSGSVVGFGEYALPAAPPTNCTSGLPVSLNAGVLTVSGVTATPLTIAPQAGNVYPVQFAPRRLPEAHIR